MKNALGLMAVCGLALSPSFAATGAKDPELALSVEVKEEVSIPDEQGNVKVIHREVEMADPGDVLVYTLTYKNVGKASVRDAVVNDAVPEGTILLPGSVQGDKTTVTFSVDGGKSYVSFPARLQVAAAGGGPVEKPAPPEAYTHIRWAAKSPMAPGESRTVSFKVIVR